MNKKKIIAVIGQGFVGGSLSIGMQHAFDVYAYDKSGKLADGVYDGTALYEIRGPRERWSGDKHNPHIGNIGQLVSVCEVGAPERFTGVYFIAVPTPMTVEGRADLSIVESVLRELAKIDRNDGFTNRIAVIKSTCPPGSTQRWNEMFADTPLRVVFNPEFLTEANAIDDFKNQDRIVLGGPRPFINVVKGVFETAFPKVPIVKTSSTTAEMVKYVTNISLAVKVALANELSQVCEALDSSGLDIDYDKVIEYATLDKRLGTSHWKVPGPDGHRGFGGSCFPKDLNALAVVAHDHGVNAHVMRAAWKKNLEVRPEQDWMSLKGRAVV